MRKSKFIFAILVSAVVLSATFVIVAIGNDIEGEITVNTYDISTEDLAENNKQVKVLDDDTLVFGSSGEGNTGEENTVVSTFKVSSGEIEKKVTLESSTYNSIAVDNKGKPYVAYPYVTEQGNQLAICDVDSGKRCVTNYYYDNTDGFEFDNENNLYILSCMDNSPVELNKCQLELKEGRDSLVCKNISTYAYNNEKNILSLSKGAGNGEIYFTSTDGVYSFKTTDTDQPTNKLLLYGEFDSRNTIGLKSISDKFLIDNACILYSSELTEDKTSTDSIEKIYKTFARDINLVSCSAEGDIIICIGNMLYLLDDNGTATAQCKLENTPENIFCMGDDDDSIVAISFKDCAYTQGNNCSAKVDVVSLSQLKKQKNIQYDELQESDDTFTAAPVNEVKLDVVENSHMWDIFINTEDISVAKRGIPTVEITDINTNKVYIRSNSLNNLNISEDGLNISFTPPENIEAHEYQILLKDAVNTGGAPICLKYTVHVVDENEDTSDGLIESEVYNIDRNLKTISGISPGTNVSQFKSKLKYNGDLNVKSMQGNILSSGSVGNAATVELFRNSNLIDSLTVIVYGDIDGSGKLDSKDVRRCCDYVIGIDNLNEWQSLAMDVNRDGQSDIVDLVIINGCLNGKYSIEQK